MIAGPETVLTRIGNGYIYIFGMCQVTILCYVSKIFGCHLKSLNVRVVEDEVSRGSFFLFFFPSFLGLFSLSLFLSFSLSLFLSFSLSLFLSFSLSLFLSFSLSLLD